MPIGVEAGTAIRQLHGTRASPTLEPCQRPGGFCELALLRLRLREAHAVLAEVEDGEVLGEEDVAEDPQRVGGRRHVHRGDAEDALCLAEGGEPQHVVVARERRSTLEPLQTPPYVSQPPPRFLDHVFIFSQNQKDYVDRRAAHSSLPPVARDTRKYGEPRPPAAMLHICAMHPCPWQPPRRTRSVQTHTHTQCASHQHVRAINDQSINQSEAHDSFSIENCLYVVTYR